MQKNESTDKKKKKQIFFITIYGEIVWYNALKHIFSYLLHMI